MTTLPAPSGPETVETAQSDLPTSDFEVAVVAGVVERILADHALYLPLTPAQVF